VLLDRLLGDAPGRSIVVKSATGYRRRFPREAASDLLVATRLGDGLLTAAHGHPARLVAPGRRGFWWVKWVTESSVDDRPSWGQLPFPVT
jgi:DMSO/TMAO reductase YedYZ molybdopterin-dependent catalytic subunit